MIPRQWAACYMDRWDKPEDTTMLHYKTHAISKVAVRNKVRNPVAVFED